ncbi:hypothetical protein [Mesorhizobium sp. B2-6-2]|uniref:hypothetical protein n=1 Tax=Mesorhizobium sp. B2-6-2 TaxID=2589915 RepID=UPI00112D394E|nr:hypothetical protein [Mesorhizobium sp. B2-6-2]
MSAAAKRVFTLRPYHLVPDFLKHVSETGKPHTWPHNSHEGPAPDGVVVLKLNVSIPKHLVSLNGRAPCPICSPDHPKYETGHLLWSEATGKLHAVGHCCGHHYFTDGLYAESIAAAEKRAKRIVDEAAIEANWRVPAHLVTLANTIRGRVRAFDGMVRFIRKGLSPELARIIYRNAAEGGGILSVLEYVAVNDDAEGSLKAVSRPFNATPLLGYEILRGGKRSVSAEGRLHQATISFEQLGWQSEDDAIGWLAIQPDKDLQQLARWIKDASAAFDGLRRDLLGIQRFLETDNLNLLNEWLKEVGRSDVRLVRDRSHLTIWRSGRSRAVIPPVLDDEVFASNYVS